MLTPADKIAEELEPIADLMADPTVTEIQVRRGGAHLFVERDGQTRLLAGRTFPFLEEAIRGIAGACGRDVPAAYPVVDARLEAYDARMAAMLPPNARGGAMMTIRLFPRRYTLPETRRRRHGDSGDRTGPSRGRAAVTDPAHCRRPAGPARPRSSTRCCRKSPRASACASSRKRARSSRRTPTSRRWKPAGCWRRSTPHAPPVHPSRSRRWSARLCATVPAGF